LIFNFPINRKKLLSDRESLGRWGEKASEKFLKRKGLKTLTRNFSCRTGELDLVMVDPDGGIVFVEVKARTDEKFADVEDSITSAKKNRLKKTARYFLASNDIQDRPCRFDIVTIVLGRTGRPQIRHYENAFVP
jgi:putative endonuclease